MPVVNCPLPECGFSTDDVEAIIGVAQLNIHALTHQQGSNRHGSATPSKQKPPKVNRPTISRGTTEETWHTFLKRWDIFKQGTDIPAGQTVTQLWQCCDQELEEDLFKYIENINDTNEQELLQTIKRLAVIPTVVSVRKAELLSMNQDHGQPIRTFAAKVKGKAQVCAFSKKCTSATCQQTVDYTDDIVKYVLISGISDEEIKKDVLGHEDLDDKTLNETITIIESKEMASRAIQGSRTETAAIHQNVSKKQHSNELESKLATKTACTACKKPMVKFKIRNGKLREFTHCLQCWRKINPSKSGSNQSSLNSAGAIFDVLGGINVDSTRTAKGISLQHHIFDGTYGWMIKESPKQPSIKLRLSTNESDYKHFGHTRPRIKPSTISAITDTGAQSSLMGLKVFKRCGFKQSDLLPVKKKMHAANNEGINILGAVLTRLTGTDATNGTVETAEMIYISDTTDLFYLSRNAMERLKIIPTNFPKIGAAGSTTDNVVNPPPKDLTDSISACSSTQPAKCGCPKRVLPPTRPDKLPFDAVDENVDKMKDWLLHRYAASTFNKCPHQTLPMMSGPPISIHIDPDAPPSVVHTPAPIPIHWREEIKRQLDADVSLGVIEKLEPNTPTTWCHRAIWVRKPDGSPRRVVDFQALNRHCIRETHHTVPPFQQARSIPSNTYRSVTDAWNGYHSVPVREEDRHLLTFITEFGRYRYCAAPQGYMASGDGYTHRYDRIIADVPRKTKCVDDTVVWDTDLEEHWWRMVDYLELVGREGIVLNPKKFQFSQRNIEFAGFEISSNDVKPLTKYLRTIQEFPQPKSIADIRAWFGLVNQVSHYSKISDIMIPFKPLLSPKTKFLWTDELSEAFEHSKVAIIDAIKHGVQIFDINRRTCLTPDWSKTGIGYWLRQKYCSCDSLTPDCCPNGWKITLAGSRFLRAAETRYAPIEGEALGIAWALMDSKYFTLGCDDLIVTTDHKPLVKIFGDRALDEISNDRLLKLKQRTFRWRFHATHVPGKLIPASDATSRNPSLSTQSQPSSEWLSDASDMHIDAVNDIDCEILASIQSSLSKVCAVTWERVKAATIKDEHLQTLKSYIINGFPEKCCELPDSVKPYWNSRYDLSITDEVILFGNRIVIPATLRSEVCSILHSAHQGTGGMNERAKATVFWPGITDAIQKRREQCATCWRIAPSQQHLPPAEPFVPTSPFQAIATDYCKQGGYHYLITVDRFSNWPEVSLVKPGSSTAGASGLIRALKRNFATFGVPEQLSSDGGPEFASKETDTFLQRWGVTHRLSSAYNPRSNGRAEVAVKSMKRLLSDNISSNGDIDTESFTRAILQFRNTPDPHNGLSPAEVLFGRPIRDALPIKPRSQVFENTDVRPIWREFWGRREDTLRTRSARQVESLNCRTRQLLNLEVGDSCRIQNQTGQFPGKWDKTGRIVHAGDNDQYLVKVHGSGRITLRNRKYLRKIQPSQPSHDVGPSIMYKQHVPPTSKSSPSASISPLVKPTPAHEVQPSAATTQANVAQPSITETRANVVQHSPASTHAPTPTRVTATQPTAASAQTYVARPTQANVVQPSAASTQANVVQSPTDSTQANVGHPFEKHNASPTTDVGLSTQAVDPMQQPRRSTRAHKSPSWHNDYVV